MLFGNMTDNFLLFIFKGNQGLKDLESCSKFHDFAVMGLVLEFYSSHFRCGRDIFMIVHISVT